MPDSPFFREKRNSSLPIPIGETIPTPVIQIRSFVAISHPPLPRQERVGVRGII
jgi:hypothetical protein